MKIPAVASLLALVVTLGACEDIGREYPRGYTDNGIKFDEDDWRFWPGDARVGLSYIPSSRRPKITIMCHRAIGVSANLEVSTSAFDPLQQGPHPELALSIDDISAADLPTLTPFKDENPNMSITVGGRDKNLMLREIRAGKPMTLRFAGQVLEIPGPPESMRNGFVSQCSGNT